MSRLDCCSFSKALAMQIEKGVDSGYFDRYHAEIVPKTNNNDDSKRPINVTINIVVNVPNKEDKNNNIDIKSVKVEK